MCLLRLPFSDSFRGSLNLDEAPGNMSSVLHLTSVSLAWSPYFTSILPVLVLFYTISLNDAPFSLIRWSSRFVPLVGYHLQSHANAFAHRTPYIFTGVVLFSPLYVESSLFWVIPFAFDFSDFGFTVVLKVTFRSFICRDLI